MKQLFIFAIINSFLIFLSMIVYWITTQYYNLIYLYLTHLTKTFILLITTKYSQRNKEYITTRENYTFDSFLKINPIMHVFSSVFIETITYYIISHFFIFVNKSCLYDLLLFIPVSFIFEIIYDFMHYWVHRSLHYNKFLYKYIHKKHHSKINVTYLDTYYQNPIDLIFSNSIPFYLSLIIISNITNISYFQFVLLTVYKTSVEIAGHTGKKTYPTSSFPQFPWLVKYLNMELYTENHDLHHKYPNCNFSKRFSLWDKIFMTYASNKNKINIK